MVKIVQEEINKYYTNVCWAFFLDGLTLEDGASRVSRNVGK